MKTLDVGGMIVMYNLVIGVLVMLSSEKLGAFAGHLNKTHRSKIARITRVSTLTFGSCVAVLSAGIYVAVYILRIGV